MKGPASTAERVRFAGWPKPALQFFDGLKKDNSKAFFEAHRQVYEEQVRHALFASCTLHSHCWPSGPNSCGLFVLQIVMSRSLPYA